MDADPALRLEAVEKRLEELERKLARAEIIPLLGATLEQLQALEEHHRQRYRAIRALLRAARPRRKRRPRGEGA